MQHHRTVTRTIFTDVLRIETLGHRKIDLNRAALPMPANSVFQGVFNLGAIKSTFAGSDFEIAT